MRERSIGRLIPRKETEAVRIEEQVLLIALINSIPDLVCKKIFTDRFCIQVITEKE
jgi:hypothetical protein